MSMPGMKSRPVYVTLQADPGGRHHVLVGQGSGGAALPRLLARMPPGTDARVLYRGTRPRAWLGFASSRPKRNSCPNWTAPSQGA